ncbi:MAG: outer membrane protein assembly factor BamE [Holosporales bacterium]|jgi:outer membrane protein assembly factor BamE (lipoprotein component of BamABCDE complex)|nr:outer membrane protein assembly factor BamE [Holosporales bacterium]
MHKGCYVQSFDLLKVKEHVDTKETIREKFGIPSTTSVFNKGVERWYYVHRIISESPARGRKSVLHQSIFITFDKRGVVQEKGTISGENEVDICKDVTKDAGYKTTFLRETFGNIGKFSQSGGVLK